MKKSTSTDVAKLAGVSQSAVSMILNHRANASFSEETVRSVFEAAQTLGYSLKGKSEGVPNSLLPCIAVVCPTLSNPYYSTLIQSVECEALLKEYMLFVCNTLRDPQIEKKYLESLLYSSISGIIFTYMPNQIDWVNSLAAKLPVVIVGDKNESVGIDTVELNSMESGKLVAEHLLSLGHRRIAFISTPLSENVAPRFRRFEGLKTALENSGFKTKLVVRDASPLPSDQYGSNQELRIGYESTLDVLASEDVTAFVGVNDMVSYGILDALAYKKCRVPEDFSVCGLDNIFPSAFSGVSLTTIDHFISCKGRDAFEILYKKMSSRQPAASTNSIFKIEYKPVLISRNSTGPCPSRP